METVTASQKFSGNLDEFVAYTRTLSSRTNWPGAVLEYEQPDTLHYSVGLRLKGAAITDIHIEDKLGEVERLEDGAIVYSTTQKVLWPAGHADAITEYRFTPRRGRDPHGRLHLQLSAAEHEAGQDQGAAGLPGRHGEGRRGVTSQAGRVRAGVGAAEAELSPLRG